MLALLLLTWSAAAAPLGFGTTTTFKIVPRPTYTATTVAPSTSISTTTETTDTTEFPTTTSTITEPQAQHLDVDVVIYGTTTAGIGALRGLQLAKAAYPHNLRVAVVAGGPHIESPIAQGLAVEDLYGPETASGFYREFRDAVLRDYAAQGVNAAPYGRMTVEPEVAARILRWYIDLGGKGRPGVSFVQGRLLAAEDGEERSVTLRTVTGVLKIHTNYFIDASPEGDLARLLGADYRIGRSEEIFNDKEGRLPPRPSRANDWSTSPQSLSVLLTLRLYPNSAPSVASLGHPSFRPLTYGVDFSFSEWARSSFATSWTMRNPLPNKKRELNEAWGDYTDPDASYDWVMFPEKRADIRNRIQNWILNKVEWLRTHGYPNVGVATVPNRPYVRDGIRVVGRVTYTQDDILRGVIREPVAFGVYALWDRHDTVYGSRQDSRPGYVHVPMGALMPQGHPFMLVGNAVSVDALAQCSAVRMEPVRANMGGACGIITAIAAALGISCHDVPYDLVQKELNRQGYSM